MKPRFAARKADEDGCKAIQVGTLIFSVGSFLTVRFMNVMVDIITFGMTRLPQIGLRTSRAEVG